MRRFYYMDLMQCNATLLCSVLGRCLRSFLAVPWVMMGLSRSTYTCDGRGPLGIVAHHNQRPGFAFAVGDMANFCPFPFCTYTHDMASDSADPNLVVQLSKSGVAGAMRPPSEPEHAPSPARHRASSGYQFMTEWRA